MVVRGKWNEVNFLANKVELVLMKKWGIKVMKPIGIFCAFLLLPWLTPAQSLPDTLRLRAPSILESKSKSLDSLLLKSKSIRWRDSLSVGSWSGNLKKNIEHNFSTERVTRFSDSLRLKGLPESSIARQADSLLLKKESLLNEVADKQAQLQKRVTSRYDEWSSSLKKQFNLDSAGVRLPGMTNAGLPQTPNTTTPYIPGANMPGIPTMPALESSDFASLGMSPELTSIGGSTAIPSTNQLGEWQQSMPAMPDPGGMVNDQLSTIKDIKSDPGAAAEKAATQVAEVNDAAKGLKDAEQLKSNNEMLKTAEQMKDPNAAMEMGKQQAIDHFAGKEAALQGAMTQMSKYKQKYSSLGSLSEIKKNDWLPKNGLKGKPFKERVRVGMNMAYKGGDTLLFDLFPNASYRITGRIEAGLGAIYRVRVIQKPFGFDQRDPVWGTSSFVVVKTFKSVFFRIEMDGNSFPVTANSEHSAYRDWRWSFYSGIQTNFKFGKQWTGIIQMLYNFDANLKDGFPEKLALRAGVQYKLSK